MRPRLAVLCLAALAAIPCPARAAAAPLRGEVLYKTTLLRAAPGRLLELVAAVKGKAPWIFRHSQGDHWDLMLLAPVGSYPEHLKEPRAVAPLVSEELVSWQEEEFVR